MLKINPKDELAELCVQLHRAAVGGGQQQARHGVGGPQTTGQTGR